MKQYEAIKYNGKWCIYAKQSKTYHFIYKGKKENKKAEERLNK